MEQLLEQIASGLANGAIYACVALALVMIYVSTDHLNFAQGEMAMFSTYISWQLMNLGMRFLAGLHPDDRDLVRAGRDHRAGDPATAAQCTRALRRRGLHRPAGDLQFDGRRDLELPDQGISVAVPEGDFRCRGRHRPAPAGRGDRHPGRAHPALPVLPLHAARPRHARGRAEPADGAPGRRARRLDAGARLGPRRRGRLGRGNDGGPHRLPRSRT